MKSTTDTGDAAPAEEELNAATDQGEDTGSSEPEADEVGEELSEIEQAIRERDEAKSLWMRAQADYQNLRRRQQADIDAAVQRAKTEVLGEAVTVLDYLDMALAAPVTTDEAKNLKIGVEMTRGQLQGLFDRLSVKPIVAEGAFDPALHQAVSTVESTEHEAGTIVEVVRGGWLMGETVLRFAQVRVASAPESDAEQATEGEPAAESEAAQNGDAKNGDAGAGQDPGSQTASEGTAGD